MDSISNMIIQIKNAGIAGHSDVHVPYSKLKHSVAEALKKEGFIKDAEKETYKSKPVLSLELFLENRMPKIKGVKRISKPSKRVYKKFSEIHAVKSGYGAMIISTSKGIMSGREARKAKLGGEALFLIW